MHSYGEKDLVAVASFNNAFDAQICCGLLLHNDIHAVVMDESVGSLFAIAVGGAKVCVLSTDADRARTIIEAEIEEDHIENEGYDAEGGGENEES